MTLLTWLGVILCLFQSAIFSGLNLGFFSLSKLRLELEAAKGNPRAKRILKLRKNSNFLLVTILWGNVAVNVLLTILTRSMLTGLAAFLFSTVFITLIGEIAPQAYFSRHALKVAAFFSPLLRVYQFILFPVAKPTAMVLDKWLGPEGISYFKEKDFHELIKMHAASGQSEISVIEGQGVLNFLAMDDILLKNEGELIDPKSVITLPFKNDRPVFPPIIGHGEDEFMQLINQSGKKWVIICDPKGEPKIALNADSFLREAVFKGHKFNPYLYCHRPIIIKNEKTFLGEVVQKLKVHPERQGDDVIDRDIIIFWGEREKIITGSDILGRLLRGIVKNEAALFEKIKI